MSNRFRCIDGSYAPIEPIRLPLSGERYTIEQVCRDIAAVVNELVARENERVALTRSITDARLAGAKV